MNGSGIGGGGGIGRVPGLSGVMSMTLASDATLPIASRSEPATLSPAAGVSRVVTPRVPGGPSPSAPSKEAERAHHAALQFESIFVRQLLDAAKIMGPEGGAGSGYQSMATEALADGVLRAGGLGLARQIEAALANTGPQAHDLGSNSTPPPSPENISSLPSQVPPRPTVPKS